ncbi:hypothetical protein Ciccas_003318 [Cichlidogyrus casuarinus]|uniref:Uncharacterized protein n=1 Tax=Cichlidogyrus casuarinus TaxID=1844966 RepID=A0ABD2QER3_9PLAT
MYCYCIKRKLVRIFDCLKAFCSLDMSTYEICISELVRQHLDGLDSSIYKKCFVLPRLLHTALERSANIMLLQLEHQQNNTADQLFREARAGISFVKLQGSITDLVNRVSQALEKQLEKIGSQLQRADLRSPHGFLNCHSNLLQKWHALGFAKECALPISIETIFDTVLANGNTNSHYPCILQGSPRSGKTISLTMLFAKTILNKLPFPNNTLSLSDNAETTLFISSFADVSDGTPWRLRITDGMQLQRHLCLMALKQIIAFEDEFNFSMHDRKEEITLVHKLANKLVNSVNVKFIWVILIDNLDQLLVSSDPSRLLWLKDPFPARVHVFLTCTTTSMRPNREWFFSRPPTKARTCIDLDSLDFCDSIRSCFLASQASRKEVRLFLGSLIHEYRNFSARTSEKEEAWVNYAMGFPIIPSGQQLRMKMRTVFEKAVRMSKVKCDCIWLHDDIHLFENLNCNVVDHNPGPAEESPKFKPQFKGNRNLIAVLNDTVLAADFMNFHKIDLVHAIGIVAAAGNVGVTENFIVKETFFEGEKVLTIEKDHFLHILTRDLLSVVDNVSEENQLIPYHMLLFVYFCQESNYGQSSLFRRLAMTSIFEELLQKQRDVLVRYRNQVRAKFVSFYCFSDVSNGREEEIVLASLSKEEIKKNRKPYGQVPGEIFVRLTWLENETFAKEIFLKSVLPVIPKSGHQPTCLDVFCEVNVIVVLCGFSEGTILCWHHEKIEESLLRKKGLESKTPSFSLRAFQNKVIQIKTLKDASRFMAIDSEGNACSWKIDKQGRMNGLEVNAKYHFRMMHVISGRPSEEMIQHSTTCRLDIVAGRYETDVAKILRCSSDRKHVLCGDKKSCVVLNLCMDDIFSSVIHSAMGHRRHSGASNKPIPILPLKPVNQIGLSDLHLTFIDFSSDSMLLLAADSGGVVKVWSQPQWVLIQVLYKKRRNCDDMYLNSVQIPSSEKRNSAVDSYLTGCDGCYQEKLIAAGSKNGSIIMWNLSTGNCEWCSNLQYVNKNSEVLTIKCLGTQKRVISLHKNGIIRLWEDEKGTLLNCVWLGYDHICHISLTLLFSDVSLNRSRLFAVFDTQSAASDTESHISIWKINHLNPICHKSLLNLRHSLASKGKYRHSKSDFLDLHSHRGINEIKYGIERKSHPSSSNVSHVTFEGTQTSEESLRPNSKPKSCLCIML